jgi:hypothetical protein
VHGASIGSGAAHGGEALAGVAADSEDGADGGGAPCKELEQPDTAGTGEGQATPAGEVNIIRQTLGRAA